MATIADAVFDAALNHIAGNVDKVQIRNASSTVLVSKASGITSADFGAAGDNSGSGGGRKIECLTGSDFQGLSVSSAGSATKVLLLSGSTTKIVASIASAPVSLGASDQVNIGSFSVILKDPS